MAAIAADSMSSAIARDCDRRRMIAGSPISQLRLSTLATVPVRITRFCSKPASPVTSHVLDNELAPWAPIPALAEMQIALELAVGASIIGFDEMKSRHLRHHYD